MLSSASLTPTSHPDPATPHSCKPCAIGENNNMPVFSPSFPIIRSLWPAQHVGHGRTKTARRFVDVTNVYRRLPKSEATLQTLEVVCTTSEPEDWSCDALEKAEGKSRQTCTLSQKHRLRRRGMVNSEQRLPLFLPL